VSDSDHSSTFTGWREWVALPEVGVSWLKAKIDTGAQTSALHATQIEEFTRDGSDWVRFTVHPWQDSELDAVHVERLVHDRRTIRSSSGHSQDRLVVLMNVTLCKQTLPAEVTLTSRDEMVFRMLIGREVLRQGFVVDSAESYLGGRPSATIRRRNRGRV
jgi:hypothetical protein